MFKIALSVFALFLSLAALPVSAADPLPVPRPIFFSSGGSLPSAFSWSVNDPDLPRYLAFACSNSGMVFTAPRFAAASVSMSCSVVMYVCSIRLG